MNKRSGPARLPIPLGWYADLSDFLTELEAAGSPTPTVTLRRQHLSRIARALGSTPGNVTAARLKRWFASQTHWANETRRGYRNSALAFFGWAYRQGRVANNVALELPFVKPSKPSPRPLPDDAWTTAVAAADARELLMLRLAAECGLRRAEVAQVHVSDVSNGLSGPQLLVHGKGKKDRIIPIADDLAQQIHAGASGHTPDSGDTSGFLFPGKDGGHLSPRWVGKLCTRVLPSIWTLHKCRHRFAAKVYRGTRNIRALQILLGHASLATTEIYTPVDDDEIRTAMMAAAA